MCAHGRQDRRLLGGADEELVGKLSPPQGERFVAISSSAFQTCTLREDGTPACWWYDKLDVQPPPEGERFIALSNGDYHTCALREDGTPACWASPESSDDLRPPVGERFSAIRTGSRDSACGIRDDGSVSCWCEEFMPEYLQGERFIDISFRSGQACALLRNGSPVC